LTLYGHVSLPPASSSDTLVIVVREKNLEGEKEKSWIKRNETSRTAKNKIM
jgi:hypothetical protein